MEARRTLDPLAGERQRAARIVIARSGLRRPPPLRQLVFNTAAGMVGVMLAATPTSAVPLGFSDETLRQHAALLTEMARKYIWWMPAEEALDYPARIVAQVMNIGVFRDTCRVADAFGDDCLRAVVSNAEAGWFNARSWHYWHYRLDLAAVDHVPPLPVRRLA